MSEDISSAEEELTESHVQDDRAESENRTEVEILKTRIVTLEHEIDFLREELEAVRSHKEKDEGRPKHSSFKVGTVVKCMVPWSTEWETGKIAYSSKEIVEVSTRRGPVTFMSEARGRIIANG